MKKVINNEICNENININNVINNNNNNNNNSNVYVMKVMSIQ